MLSEPGSTEVCKSIQELGPRLPTNAAEVKERHSDRDESQPRTAKQMPVHTARHPISLPIPKSTKQQPGNTTEEFKPMKNDDTFGL